MHCFISFPSLPFLSFPFLSFPPFLHSFLLVGPGSHGYTGAWALVVYPKPVYRCPAHLGALVEGAHFVAGIRNIADCPNHARHDGDIHGYVMLLPGKIALPI